MGYCLMSAGLAFALLPRVLAAPKGVVWQFIGASTSFNLIASPTICRHSFDLRKVLHVHKLCI